MEILKKDRFVRDLFIIAVIGCVLAALFRSWKENETKTALPSYEGQQVVYEVPEE